MESKTQHGYLILADISGYTSYLAGTELEHSHEILTDLLELIIHNFKSLLTISKLEGDAVFAYASENKIPRGETLLELIEATYVAFKDRVVQAAQRTTCTCEACRRIPTLDLKFMLHHGDYILQHVADVTELVGSDVNLAHRLMKNHVSEETGWRAYAMFSERALEHMGVRPEAMYSRTENYEHLGEIPTQSLDLSARYKELTDARHIVVTAEEAAYKFSVDFPAAPAVVWDWLSNPVGRNRWFTKDFVWSSADRPAGRTSPGSRNHCAHGKDLHVETILDWRPFDYCTTFTEPMKGIKMTTTVKLEPFNGGTRVSGFLKMEGKMPGFVLTFLAKMMGKQFYKDKWEHCAQLIAQQGISVEETEAQALPTLVTA